MIPHSTEPEMSTMTPMMAMITAMIHNTFAGISTPATRWLHFAVTVPAGRVRPVMLRTVDDTAAQQDESTFASSVGLPVAAT
jgi:hypothetical protein